MNATVCINFGMFGTYAKMRVPEFLSKIKPGNKGKIKLSKCGITWEKTSGESDRSGENNPQVKSGYLGVTIIVWCGSRNEIVV